MASSSSSSIPKSFKYDVFLSFRGEDTRTNFVDHLYSALQQRGIHVYKDDERITKGSMISDELIRSVEESEKFIIVFSKNYASSTWCLDELVKIMECHKTAEQTAYPVFYDVEPSEVRKQIGAVGKAFAKHHDNESAEKWRRALKEAADLSGWDLNYMADGHEAKVIQRIVEDISLELRSINFSYDEKLVGLERRIKDVLSTLETGFGDVRMIGIKGMGGSGKTTLARAIFDQVSSQFEGKSFLENVREVSGTSMSGLKSLQAQVLSDVLNDGDITVSSVNDGKTMIKRMMQGRKVLAVLDDVDHIEQLEAVAGSVDWFGEGSRIIITTRDEQVLVGHRVKHIYNVDLLSDEEAICLFSRYAFGRESPIQGYKELSLHVVYYAAGLPLTIRLLGSLLSGKSELEWKDVLKRLKTIPLHETREKLELSYIGLEEEYKEIFLDVACFMKGLRKDDAIRMLESCGFHAGKGLSVLEQKSLLTISNDILGMHSHIEEMGRDIVRRSHPGKPNKHSRLWIQDEIEDILANELGTKAISGIRLSERPLNPYIVMEGIRTMKNLRFLYVEFQTGNNDLSSDRKFDKATRYFPNALRIIRWVKYPFLSLPETFQANNLAALEMPGSRIIKLWEGKEKKVLNKLRFLDLSYSMLKTLDLGMTPNLERLDLKECHNLEELHASYSKLRTLDLGMTPNLERLDLKECHNLEELHVSYSKLRTLDLGMTPNLERLDLKECHNLEELHVSYSKLRTLDLGMTPNLERLDLKECHYLEELHVSYSKLRTLDLEMTYLERLDLKECHNLEELHVSYSKLRTLDLGMTPNLERLDLKECHNLEELHVPHGCLQKLRFLDVSNSKLRTLDLGMTPNLERLDLKKCHNLEELHVSYSKLRTLDLGMTPNLERLDLKECHNLEELHVPYGRLQKLRFLDVSYSKLRTLGLAVAPNLERLDLKECHNLKKLHVSYSKLRTLDLGMTPNLERLDLKECPNLEELHVSYSKLRTLDLGMNPNLERLDLKECHNLEELDVSYSKLRTLDLGMTPNLERLDLKECHNLEELHVPHGCLQKLRFLDVSYSKLRTLDLGMTPNLERLDLKECHNLEELHVSYSKLRTLDLGMTYLERLDLKECHNLEELHVSYSKLRTLDLGMTPNLERLDLKECHNLEELHVPHGCLQKLRFLDVSYSKLRTLDLGMTPNLERLDLKECHNLEELHVSYSKLRTLDLGMTPNLERLDLKECHNLEELHVSYSKLRTLDLGMTPNLERLDLKECHNLEELHVPHGCLQKLRFLDVSYSKLRTLDLGMTPNLERLDLKECHNLAELYVPRGCLQKLVYLNLIGCSRFKSFSFIKQLELLTLLSLPKLEVNVESLGEIPRYSRDNLPKLRFTCFYLDEQASSIENRQKSVSLNLQPSTKLKSVSGSIFGLQHLRHLALDGSIPEVPQDIDQLAYLEKLSLLSTRIRCLPDSICMLKHLKSLKIKSCELLEKLPEDLGRLERLEELSLSSTSIRHLPDSICMLQQLKFLKLKSCLHLAELPEVLGRLECLEKLNLLSAGIKHLPNSICMLKHLKSLELESCQLLEKLPEDLGWLQCLEKLTLTKCASLVDIPSSICKLKQLRCLHLPYCLRVEKLPEELGRLECLKELDVKFTGISHLPHSISLVEGLRVVGSEAVLQASAFATQIQTSETETFCYIQAVDNTSTDRKQIIESTPLLGSSTTSSIHKSFMYDVFLSFRAEDTSDTFVHNLYAALQRQGTHTYMDDRRMGHGRKIDEEVIRSIQHSKFFIIIFSKNYAASSWCLDELVKIIECHKTTQHTAYSVFYDVDPSEIPNQIGAVGEDDGKWGQALEDATELAGWNMRDTTDGNEGTFIEKIVEDIWLQLWSITVYINSKIIGMGPQIEEVLSSSGPGDGDVCMIGITGREGVGKTTLARAIFDRVSSRFEGRSFVKDVREVSKADLSGLPSLQKQVLSDVFPKKDITVTSVFEGKNMIEKELGDRQVLVVLDDVNQIEQLESLAGAATWFGKGSMIIITTSDEEMLFKHGVKQIHRVRALLEDEALCLFSWFAFGGAKPVEGYEQLSLEVVHYAAGLPLAIKVLGSFVRGRTESEWIDLLQRLKEISLDEGLQLLISFEKTREKLELSYISLENENKKIFLDIACFMKGLRENDAIRILESCGFHAKDGLRVLLRKSLLTLSDDRCLGMHYCIECMGRNIVRRVHPSQPHRHSRLWIREEIEDILAKNQGTEATEVIQLSEPKLSPNIVLEGLGCMEELRCLIVESETDNDDLSSDWEFVEVRHYLPNALRFLRWVYYPVQSLPITFRADNLVALEMPDSRITELWEGGERKVLHNLRFLDLSRSMLMILDLGLTPRLECLELRECHDLVNLLTPAGSLARLVHLDLTDCSKFNSIMFIKRLESPHILSLSKLHLIAKPLKEFSWSHPNIPRLEFKCLYSEEQTSLKSLSLNLKRSTKLESFSESICGLQHLRHLTLDGCIPKVPKDIDQLAYLEKLSLLSARIRCLPGTICMLKHLKSLELKSCELLEELPVELGSLERLEELSLLSTGIRRLPDSICSLKQLKSLTLKSCLHLAELPDNLGQLECLEKLNLLSARIEHLPDSICWLKHLKSLELEFCRLLDKLPTDLGKLECLEKLILTECMSLNEIPKSICNLNNLKQFHLPFCDKVKELPEELGQVKCLRELNVKGTGISQLPPGISLVEGLRIFGSVAVLKSCVIAPEIQNSEDETFCDIPVRLRIGRTPTEGASSSRMI